MKLKLITLITLFILYLQIPVNADSTIQNSNVTFNNNKIKITFTANKNTDYLVELVNEAGESLFKIKAGVCKKNNETRIDWLIDKVKFNQNKLFIKINTGMTLELKDIIGDFPGKLSPNIAGICTDQKGNLIVLHNYGNIHYKDGSTGCLVYDKNGIYKRSIYPFSRDSFHKNKLIKKVKYKKGHLAPFLYQGETRNLLPGVGNVVRQMPIVEKDNNLLFISVDEVGTYVQPGRMYLSRLSTLSNTLYFNQGIKVLKSSNRAFTYSRNPINKLIYMSKLVENYKPNYGLFKLEDNETKTVIAENIFKYNNKIIKPYQIAFNKTGQLLISDKINNRIVILNEKFVPMNEFNIENPTRFILDQNHKFAFVIGGEKSLKIFKLNLDTGVSVLITKFKSYKKSESKPPLLAYFNNEGPEILWVAFYSNRSKDRLLRLELKGSEVVNRTDINKLNATPYKDLREGRSIAGEIMGMALNKKHNYLLINEQKFDLNTKKWSKGLTQNAGSKRGDGSFGLDNVYYAQGYKKWVRKFDSNLKPILINGKKSFNIDTNASNRLRARGITADRNGIIYALVHKDKSGSNPGGTSASVFKLKPNGELIKRDLIESKFRGTDSIRIDQMGNLYIASAIKVGDKPLESIIEEPNDLNELSKNNRKKINYYQHMYGSIIKFTPEGGKLLLDDESKIGIKGLYGKSVKAVIKNAIWAKNCVSGTTSFKGLDAKKLCGCEGIRFDVDDVGRVYFPDPLANRIGVLSTDGDLIGYFGSYANQDTNMSNIKNKNNLPLLWPHIICADNKNNIYIADRLNRRVIHAQIKYLQSKTFKINQD
ncbi:MAG: hypothetical protein COA79_22840 [Planctomycetota bacterium]|nr:MAG: hypothetical protein COA79_22840 [Planctomycetota bacterium]